MVASGIAFQIQHSVRIAAPAALVWRVITDLASYPAWNPFVVACRSDLVMGAPIWMHVRLVSPWPLPQREQILAHEPGRRLCYGLRDAFRGGLSSTCCHVVAELDSAHAQYDSTFELRGALSPVVRALLGGRLAHGFQSMTEALARRAEGLHQEGTT